MLVAHALVIKNNKPKQDLISLGLALVGGVMVFFALHSKSAMDTNETAGVMLGVLLLVIGVLGFLSKQETSTTIDPVRKIIRIRDKSFSRESVRVFPFRDIKDIRVGRLGNHADGSPIYHLVIERMAGEEIPILVGIYDHTCDKAQAMRLRDKIIDLIQKNSS